MNTANLKSKRYHPVQLGTVQLPGNLFLAPLAGYTDKAFRTICRQQGASLTYSEMVSAEGVARQGLVSGQLMERAEGEELFAIQLFANEAEVIKRALPRVLTYHPTIIDINCGCPVPKVTKIGSGSALLMYPKKIEEIVRAIIDNSDVPVSVKIRTGWDALSINWTETSEAALAGGAVMLTLHARTRSMYYAGAADWQMLKAFTEYVKAKSPTTTVFGSGDVFSAQDAYNMIEQTGVDGVMFARGAIGNPFIFRESRALLCGETLPQKASLEEKVDTMQHQLFLMSEEIGEVRACKEMRKHAAAYLKGMSFASQAKQKLVQATTVEQYREVFAELKARCHPDY